MIKTQPPAIFLKIHNKFKVQFKDIVIAYYPDIYVKEGYLPTSKMVHEQIHLDRQEKIGVVKWWDKYLSDKRFRLHEELMAYSAEIDYIYGPHSKALLQYRDIRVEQLLQEISSSMYGNMISYEEARKLLYETRRFKSKRQKTM